MAKEEGNLGSQLNSQGQAFGSSQDTWKKWAQLTAQAWVDEKLKQRLLSNPTPVLKEHGIEVPPGVDVRVVENTEKVYYFTLAAKPAGDVTELTSSQLAGVAGGVPAITICSPITINPSAPPLECITPLDPCRGKTLKA
jgi:hypothetical protein